MSGRLYLRAPAKINWGLEISGRRADGYHQLRSLMQNIDMADSIMLQPSEYRTCRCFPDPGCREEDNLAQRAWVLLKERYALPGELAIEIKKQIPPGRGLGGGSADAAAVLLGVNAMYELGLTLEQLSELAFPLGADIPFCLHGGLALVEGAGQIVRPYQPLTTYRLLLIDPGFALSTAEVFRIYDRLPPERKPHIERLLAGVLLGDRGAIGQSLGNMLEAPAIEIAPALDHDLAILESAGCAAWMSGSGSCLLALPPADREINRVLDLLASQGIGARLIRTQAKGVSMTEK
ncbi:MAG: 4-(cytidine 5'-diphospho)-2-C-methyl-D-erythritol kinase [Clostridia bacterium]|nr:4-(cytidine 5'-diphospho)-2-C-methyl-D-erythritol kinase [Clostridia bacterium]